MVKWKMFMSASLISLTCMKLHAEDNKEELVRFEIGKILNKTVWCSTDEILQNCFDKGKGKIVYLLPGLHLTDPAYIHPSTTVIVPEEAVIKLEDNAEMPQKGGTIIGIVGSVEKRIKNVKLILNGTIDGNRLKHVGRGYGYEGINIAYAEGCEVTGTGSIQNVLGDGIDIDSSNYNIIKGVFIKNNSGSGIHFGSPRPITGSRYNVVIDTYAEGNGYLHNRNGFDLSWPNKDGAFYINSIAKDNRKNWEIDGVGGIVVDSYSENTGKVKFDDTFGGADKVIVNDKDITNKDLISKKTKVIFKNDIKKLIGKDNPMFNGVSYDD